MPDPVDPAAGPPPPPLPRTFMHATSLADLTGEQRGVVIAVRSLEADLTPTTPGEVVRTMVADTLPPEDLFQVELTQLPSFYKDLRTWLTKRGVAMSEHPSRRILHILAESLYENAADKELAHEMVKIVLDAKRGRRRDGQAAAAPVAVPAVAPAAAAAPAPVEVAAVAAPVHPAEQAGSTTRMLAQQLSSRYRHDDKKFSGGDGEAFHEVVADYQQLMRSLGANHDQKLELLYFILEGEAKRYYDEQVEGQVVTFAEAVHLITDKFNPEITQTQTRNELALLRYNAFVKEGMSEVHALRELNKVITKKAPLLPLEYRTDRQKRDFLRHALIGVPWAQEIINVCQARRYTYQALYLELSNALQSTLEGRATNKREDGDDGEQTATTVPIPVNTGTQLTVPVQYTNQGTYGRPKKGVGATGKGGGAKFDPLTITGCFNCDAPDHVMRDCKKPIDYVKAAKRRLEYLGKKRGGKGAAVAVLFAAMQQMNPPMATDDDSADETSDGADELSQYETLMVTSVSDAGEGSTVGSVKGRVSEPTGGSWSGTVFRPGA